MSFNDQRSSRKEAIQLLEQDKKGKFKLRADKLEALLKDVNVKDRQLVVVSVVGAFRRGKSFLLNFMLRYLRAQNNKEDWIEGDGSLSLEGFSWRGGPHRDTTGILVWPEVFLVRDNKAVILMDTQGTFDKRTTFKDNAIIFALSTLVSSVQIFNLSERIQMDDLSNLQYFCEFGQLVQTKCNARAFQKLIFLIRDWKFPDDYKFGFEGGDKLLKEWLGDSSTQKEQSEMITTCFTDINCNLMPHPGDTVSKDQQFKGDIQSIDPVFLSALEGFIENVLEESGLVTKTVAGRPIAAQDLVLYMRSWLDALQDGDFQPQSLFQSTASIRNQNTARAALEKYEAAMQAVCGGTKSVPELPHVHEEAKEAALTLFDQTEKFGGNRIAKPTRDQLIKDIDARYETLSSQNSAKLEQEEKMAREERLREAGEAALASYHAAVEVCQGVKAVPDLPALHERAKETALAKFTAMAGTDDGENAKKYRESLQKAMCDQLEKLQARNAEKLQLQRHEAARDELRAELEKLVKNYKQVMQDNCGGTKTSKNIDQLHETAKGQAIESFKETASKYLEKDVTDFVKKLERELQDNFYFYKISNDEKLNKEQQDEIRESLRIAKNETLKVYRSLMESVTENKSTSDLEGEHARALQVATSKFNITADKFREEAEPFKESLQQDISELLARYEKRNCQLAESEQLTIAHQTMREARLDAVHQLRDELENAVASTGADGVEAVLIAAQKKALESFDQRTEGQRQCEDTELTRREIEQKLSEVCVRWRQSMLERLKREDENRRHEVKVVAEEALRIYQNTLSAVCSSRNPVTNLPELHTSTRTNALDTFSRFADKQGAVRDDVEEQRKILVQKIEDLYNNYSKSNAMKLELKKEKDARKIQNFSKNAISHFNSRILDEAKSKTADEFQEASLRIKERTLNEFDRNVRGCDADAVGEERRHLVMDMETEEKRVLQSVISRIKEEQKSSFKWKDVLQTVTAMAALGPPIVSMAAHGVQVANMLLEDDESESEDEVDPKKDKKDRKQNDGSASSSSTTEK